jgi:hypothetical protein
MISGESYWGRSNKKTKTSRTDVRKQIYGSEGKLVETVCLFSSLVCETKRRE